MKNEQANDLQALMSKQLVLLKGDQFVPMLGQASF